MTTKDENDFRKSVLTDLLNLTKDFGRLSVELSNFKWDSEELVTLQRTHIRNILKKYLVGEVSADDVIMWANAIESREDIGYETPYEDTIKQVIFELANPEINYKLNESQATEYIELLSKP